MATPPTPEGIYLETQLDDYNGDCTAAVTVDVHLTVSDPAVQVSARMIAGADGKPNFVRIWDSSASPNPPTPPSLSQLIRVDNARKFQIIKAFYDANGIAVPQGIRVSAKKKVARKKAAPEKVAAQPKGAPGRKPKK